MLLTDACVDQAYGRKTGLVDKKLELLAYEALEAINVSCNANSGKTYICPFR